MITDSFRPLVQAQAKGKGVKPRLLVVKHPLGGLTPADLEGRIDQAVDALNQAIDSEQP